MDLGGELGGLARRRAQRAQAGDPPAAPDRERAPLAVGEDEGRVARRGGHEVPDGQRGEVHARGCKPRRDQRLEGRIDVRPPRDCREHDRAALRPGQPLEGDHRVIGCGRELSEQLERHGGGEAVAAAEGKGEDPVRHERRGKRGHDGLRP